MKRLKGFVIAGLFLLGLIPPSYGLSGDELTDLIDLEKNGLHKAYRVCHDDPVLMRKASISFKAQLQETTRDKRCMIMLLDEEDMASLEEYGFKMTPARRWVKRRNKVLDRLKERFSEQESRIMAPADGHTLTAEGVDTIPGFSCYETVEGTFTAAQALAANYPRLASWIDIGDSWAKENGSGGYDLMVLKLTNADQSGPKPILFINSAIHAREYTTAPLVLHFATYLINQYGIDADATWILDYTEIHMLLQTNPDGRKYAETGLTWRKNANQNYCRFLSNYRGADLNRNFSFSWYNSEEGSSGTQCAEDYRGPYAASEPETQAMEDYIRSIYPDRRGEGMNDAAPADTSGIHLDIHSYSELLLWPWGSTADVAPNGIQMQTLGRKFAYWNGYTPQQSIGLYPTDGTTDGVSYGELGVPSFTFELGTEFFEDCNHYNQTIVPDNMPALIYAAKVARSPYITPAGPNTEDVSLNVSTAMPGDTVTLSATASDDRFNNSNGTEPTQAISAAEYYVDTPPWEEGATPIAMRAADGYFNSSTENVSAVIDTSGWESGKYTLFVRSRDTGNVWGAVSAVFLTIGDGQSEDAYCDAQGMNADDSWIAGVRVGDLNNTSGSAGYSDFTSMNVALAQGTHSVTLTPDFSGGSVMQYWKIFIDLDQDGSFGAGEELFSANSSAAVSGSLTIPETSLLGETRMRVLMKGGSAPHACETFDDGEVEDYTVTIEEGGGTPVEDFYYENTTQVSIPDRSSIVSTIEVPRDAPAVDSVTISVTTTHQDLGDLSIVASNNGQSVTVKTRRYFDNSYGTATYTATVNSSYFGSFTGTWTLTVTDNYRRDVGTLDSWSISQ